MPNDLISRAEAKAAIATRIDVVEEAERSCRSQGLVKHAAGLHSNACGMRMALDELDAVPAAEGRCGELRAWLVAEIDRLQRQGLRYGHAHSLREAAILMQIVGRMDLIYSPPAGEKAEGARQYDEHGQPICNHCGKKTNRDYAKHVKLQCWNCGLYMPDLTSRADAAQRERE
jgi:hypothetical protein